MGKEEQYIHLKNTCIKISEESAHTKYRLHSIKSCMNKQLI